MTTRTRAKKPTTKKTPARTTPAPAPIPARPHPTATARPFMTDAQTTAYVAALRAGVTRLTITGWEQQADGTLLQVLPTGAALTYAPGADTPLTALTPCAAGLRHPHPVTTVADLRRAQADADACTGHQPPQPEPGPTVRPLADAFPHITAADTQPLEVTTLRADHAQEHPNG
ncbi:hypothetical protein [Streptomyces sp. NPDC056069]|uniref:hypothetical protein n=1 Tax=Streptomyces sp. NPDC056069 TaxID=3345702 RepID=UPI0035D7666D